MPFSFVIMYFTTVTHLQPVILFLILVILWYITLLVGTIKGLILQGAHSVWPLHCLSLIVTFVTLHLITNLTPSHGFLRSGVPESGRAHAARPWSCAVHAICPHLSGAQDFRSSSLRPPPPLCRRAHQPPAHCVRWVGVVIFVLQGCVFVTSNAFFHPSLSSYIHSLLSLFPLHLSLLPFLTLSNRLSPPGIQFTFYTFILHSVFFAFSLWTPSNLLPSSSSHPPPPIFLHLSFLSFLTFPTGFSPF